jgi:hypothetical protein
MEIVQRTPGTKGFTPLPRRWTVERTYGWLMLHRRLARDYETLPARSEGRSCGMAKDWSRGGVALHRDRHAPATDPYFDVRLWLQTETRHGWVWPTTWNTWT